MSTLTITTIQTYLHWENKAANLEMLEYKINSIAEKTELVVLPEMFNTGFSMNPEALAETMEGPTLQWMFKMAAAKKIILTGSLIIEEGGNYYNRLIWMLPNGKYGCYDKRHLFGNAGEDQYFERGHKRLIAAVKGWKINLQICYDLRFPVWARQSPDITGNNGTIHTEYDILLYVANWPEKRNHAWKTLLQARSIENQCFVVGVNRTGEDGNGIYHSGDSMVVDPLGHILFTQAHQESIHTITLEKNTLQDIRNHLPFLKDGDAFRIISDLP